MQRIDENTYIDETLVTCAEYQLFIDEMREQRKYYQPDHWTTHQFPSGQARKPILGVRYLDAIAFCDWLTKRQAGDWRYRLPNIEETMKFPLKPNRDQLALGYWIISTGNVSRFVWIGAVPNNPRKIVYDLDPELNTIRALDYISTYPQDSDLDFVLARDLDFAHDLDLARAGFHDYKPNYNRTQALDQALLRARARVQANPYDLDRALELHFDIFTLRERIAGRSPAFEGIRLVKERTR